MAENEYNTMQSANSTLATEDRESILDSNWAKRAFSVSDERLNENDRILRYWTTAYSKFTDTRLGGSIGINARPQFTPYSDIRIKGRIVDRNEVTVGDVSGDHGMGRVYSENFDDTSQTVFMRFGVPEFSSLMTYMNGAVDGDMSILARTGRSTNFAYTAGKVLGRLFVVSAFPVLSLTILGTKLIGFFMGRKSSKYYTMKPTMYSYWSAVSMLVNTIAINKGILPRVMMDDKSDQKVGGTVQIDKATLDALSAAMPDTFTANFGYDMFAIAGRANRRAITLSQLDYEAINDDGVDLEEVGLYRKEAYLKKEIEERGDPFTNFGKWIDYVATFKSYTGKKDKDPNTEYGGIKIGDTSTPTSTQNSGDSTPTEAQKFSDSAYYKQFFDFYDNEARSGTQFATFKVNPITSMNESWSNSTVESEISSTFNNESGKMRETRFSLQDGKVIDMGAAANAVIDGAKDVARGVVAGATFNFSEVLMGFLGNAFIDIPKHWSSSTANLPRGSYSMQLISPYGNVFSQMQNIYIPLAMIMAASLPLSTGNASYTSPFLCQLFHRGIAQIQLGMVESLSITRGACNLPFNNRGQTMAIDVSWTVVDLSSIMHMPISTGGLLNTITGDTPNLNEDNILFDYLAVLAGQDLYSQEYMFPRAKLKMAKYISNLGSYASPARLASFTHESLTTGSMQWLFPLSVPAKILDAAVAGSSALKTLVAE